MTPNDVQIDVLMRRYARSAGGASSTEHLDADELNAFAEGSLPPSARARYVSHIADCDSCRQLVSQLAISAGALNRTEPLTAQAGARVSWTKRLAALFAPRTLRYAAFAMVLIAAVGVIFLVTRRPARNSALVAQNEKTDSQTAPAIQPPETKTFNDQSPKAEANRAATTSAPAATPTPAREADDSKVASSSTVTATRTDATVPAAPGVAAKSGETTAAEQRPSYAPPPPGETQASGPRVRQQQSPDLRQQQTVGGLAQSGPRKSDVSEDKYKAMEKQAPLIASKDSGTDESNRGLTNQAPALNRSISREKRSGPSRNMDNVATNENRIEPPKSVVKKETRDAGTSESEEAPQTRSVGGRKFRRQGASWIDVKFKTSMSLITVNRGSQEFSSLDSGLRSIASQLSGEVIVVWKSKAYRIH